MLKNKAVPWVAAIVYVVLFIWMWTHSKAPSLHDVPVLFDAGLILSLLCLVPLSRSTAKAIMILNIILLIANIVMYFAAYRLVSSAFKN